MTEQQVLDSFHGLVKVLTSDVSIRQFRDRIGRIGIEGFTVGDVPLLALFLFDPDGKLDRIHLTWPHSARPMADPPPTDDQFRKIEGTLIRKYGVPVRGSSNAHKFMSAWFLPNTVIELDYIPPVGMDLRYDKRAGQTSESVLKGLVRVNGDHVLTGTATPALDIAARSPSTGSKHTGAADCLKIQTFDSSVLSTNDVFTELAWKVDFVNSCAMPFSVRTTFKIYDKDDFELDSASENIYVAANGLGNARGRMLVSPPEKARRMTKQGASLSSR